MLMKDEIDTLDNLLKHKYKIFSIIIRNARHLLGSKFLPVFEIVSDTKQGISWIQECIFLNNHLQLRDCFRFSLIDSGLCQKCMF